MPRVDRVDVRIVWLTERLVRIFLPPASTVRLVFTHAHAYVECLVEPQLATWTYDRLSDLLEDAGEINKWLQSWAESPARTPDRSPPWAVRRGIPPEGVQQIASRITQTLSRAAMLEQALESLDGALATLRIPPKARLVPPAPPQSSDFRGAFVSAVHRVVEAVTTAGQTMILPVSGNHERKSVVIDYNQVRRESRLFARTAKLTREP